MSSALAIGLVASIAVVTSANDRDVAEATHLPSVLFYGPTAGGSGQSNASIEATVWNETTWSQASTADFREFDAIVFGDQPICFGSPSIWDTAIANRQVWSSAITGNVIIAGTDPDWHNKTTFIRQAIDFAAADEQDGPGLYVALSCAYHGDERQTVDLLQSLGQFDVQGVDNCPSDAHKIAQHPSLDGLGDSYLSNWGCSAHEVFTSWPSSFQPLVIIKDAVIDPPLAEYQAADGTSGYVYVVATGAFSTCPDVGDDDGDCLTNQIEELIGTDPANADTDGDGLLDPWEVDPSVAGAGIRLASGEVVSRDAVFGPYARVPFPAPYVGGFLCGSSNNDDELRYSQQYRCLNQAPDPLRKDVYLELDWQDCTVSNACPEVISDDDDTLHHAPSRSGLGDAIRAFAGADVDNPDGSTGINLRILVDEAVPHTPNCDQSVPAARADSFGTPSQRRSNAVVEAKEMAVRYVWSGHSSARDSGGPCDDPGRIDFLKQGLGLEPLADYDWSPFGSANLGGRDILITLGPVWSCSSEIGAKSAVGLGYLGPCFRESNIFNFMNGLPVADPGIFPIDVPVNGSNKKINWPVTRLLGETQEDASQQLWSRGLMRLLGHNLGLTVAEANNDPTPAGRHQAGERNPLTPLVPDDYDDWSQLDYTIKASAVRIDQPFPNYDELARTNLDLSDPDNDGVLEHDDNCPGVHNPNQKNSDQASLLEQLGGFHTNILEFGDACDPDIDGDHRESSLPGQGFRAQVVAGDEFPFDTDNDGLDNDVDPDDDGDGVDDGDDNCRLYANPDQADFDDDGFGDSCDIDLDGDLVLNDLELATGSSGFDPSSTPEYVGSENSCADGVDNDGDGAVDGDDSGCVDGDGDGVADEDDLCPSVPDGSLFDRDGDGIGDACDLLTDIVWVSELALGDASETSEIGFTATRAGSYDVRLGTGCAGTLIDSGSYDPGDGVNPNPAFVLVSGTLLQEGANNVEVCVDDASGESASAETVIVLDTGVPDTFIVAGPGPDPELSPVAFTFGSDEFGVGYLCSLDGATSAPCEETSSFELDPGPHQLDVVAVDPIGRVDESPASQAFTVAAPIQFDFGGFGPPVVDPPAVVSRKAGSTAPIKFVIDGGHGLDIIAAGSPSSVAVPCGDFEAPGASEPAASTGGKGMTYQGAPDHYHFNWKTSKEWASTCRRFEVMLTDGGVYSAWFEFT